jgi:hypothetical protein
MSDESWTISCPTPHQRVDTATHALCMEIDPRHRTLTLDTRAPTAETHELNSGAVVRRFFEGEGVDWGAALAWLHTDAATAMLSAIHGGYAAEMLWSGDWRVTWSVEAAHAVDALHSHIEAQLSGHP